MRTVRRDPQEDAARRVHGAHVAYASLNLRKAHRGGEVRQGYRGPVGLRMRRPRKAHPGGEARKGYRGPVGLRTRRPRKA